MKKVPINNNSLAHTSWNCYLRQNIGEKYFSPRKAWRYEKYFANSANGKE